MAQPGRTVIKPFAAARSGYLPMSDWQPVLAIFTPTRTRAAGAMGPIPRVSCRIAPLIIG